MKTQILLSVILVSVLSLAPIFTGAIYSGSDASPSPDGVLTGNAIIVLKDQPLSSYDGHSQGYARTMPTPGHKLDLNSQASQSYSAYLANERGLAKGWIQHNAPELQVIDEYSVVLNAIAVQLNGHNMNNLLNSPGASWVVPDYLFHLDMNRSPTLIGAPFLWNAVGGQSNAGAGVKIGIIDTGIDQTHPFLTDNTLPALAGFPKCDAIDSAVGMADTQCNFVSNKVIVAKVFETRTNFDGHAAQEHGTHVSGIAAGVANTCAPFVSACNLSGIAPKAYLGNYNVFPGNVLDASSHDIAKAVEAAVADGMDVLNLSLGGTAKPNDVLVNTVNSAVDAGVVVAIAAGNAGPGPGTVESPGIADKVITVGASTNPHFIGIPVTVTSIGTFGAAIGQFANFVPAVTTTYLTTSPTNGCTAISGSLAGEIALIARGACTFSTKIRNAQSAGAIAVNVYSSIPSFGCASPPCFAFFQGTSMATPHVAGSAALLIQQHPDWSPEQVKSALVNSAHRPVKSFSTGNQLKNPMVRGGGRIDLAAASQVTATLEASPTTVGIGNGQASFSFGELPSSGITRSFDITVTSVSTSTATYSISVLAASAGPTITPSVTSLTVVAGGTGTVTVSLTLSPSLANGDYFGDIQLTGGTVPLSVPYWVRADPPNPSAQHGMIPI